MLRKYNEVGALLIAAGNQCAISLSILSFFSSSLSLDSTLTVSSVAFTSILCLQNSRLHVSCCSRPAQEDAADVNRESSQKILSLADTAKAKLVRKYGEQFPGLVWARNDTKEWKSICQSSWTEKTASLSLGKHTL